MQGEEGGEWTGSGGHFGQAHNQAQEKVEILKNIFKNVLANTLMIKTLTLFIVQWHLMIRTVFKKSVCA
jgi:hypothetical protein